MSLSADAVACGALAEPDGIDCEAGNFGREDIGDCLFWRARGASRTFSRACIGREIRSVFLNLKKTKDPIDLLANPPMRHPEPLASARPHL